MLGAAFVSGWLPEEGACYLTVNPNLPVGESQITVKDAPVDAFWSISRYNMDGYLQDNRLDAFSVNNPTCRPNDDGSVAVNLGGCWLFPTAQKTLYQNGLIYLSEQRQA
ncbi:MAG: hypothetical protein ACI92Z_002788 [Paracoccaceae bacterium]|jgi:hypothetical protein